MPEIALSKEARIAIYAERHAKGLSLFNRRDLWNKRRSVEEAEGELHVAPTGRRGMNGAVLHGRITKYVAPPPEPLTLEGVI